VRKLITEGKKIRDIEEALADSQLLKDIDPETGDFEKLTEVAMTAMLNAEEQNLREEEIKQLLAIEKMKLRTISYRAVTPESNDGGGPKKMEKGPFMFSKRTLHDVLSPKAMGLTPKPLFFKKPLSLPPLNQDSVNQTLSASRTNTHESLLPTKKQ